jgi:hypothetical protein
MPAGPGSTPPTTDGGWYSYAVLRVVPHVERGEFINVGIVLFARTLRFLEVRYELDEERLRLLAAGEKAALDIDELRRHLDVLRQIAAGDSSGGSMAGMSQSERFHWLTSPRSTVIQTSETHVGYCEDPEAAIEQLMSRLVRRGSGQEAGSGETPV